MIKALLCTVLAMVSFTANAQVKAFEKYADMKDVTYVFISKYMLGLASKNATPSIPKVDINTLKNKLTGIQIIHSEKKGMRKKLKSDVQEILDRDKYEVLMQVKEDNNNVNIFHCVNKRQSAVVMLVEEDSGITAIVFSGKFNMDDVMKMVQE